MRFACCHCGREGERSAGAVNRARKAGANLYCDRRCAGLAHRVEDTRTEEQKRADKAEYDRKRRARLKDEIREKKRDYHKLTYTQEKGRAQRARQKARGWSHTEYCRRYMSSPVKKREKRTYDAQRKSMQFVMGDAEWAECHRLLVKLERLVRSRQRWYERAKERGYYDRTNQARKRNEGLSRH